MSESGIPIGQWSGSDATEQLRMTIENYNETATKQIDEMVKLTRSIRTLTFVMVALVIGQLVVAIVALS